MSGHHPFSELIKDFSPERRRRNALGSQRLEVKIQIAETIGEKLLLENDELSDLLCDSDLDATDKELLAAIEKQLAAVAGTPDDLTPARRRRLAELTGLAVAYNNRGNAYANIGEYDQAIADYAKALELNPDYAAAYNNRGNAYAKKGEYDLAIADFTKALELNPDHAAAYNNRGNAYVNIGEYDQAIADYAKALELNPDYAAAYNNRGNAYAKKGEYDLAIADFTKALELNPDNAATRENLATTTRLRNSATEYDQAIQENHQDPDVWHARGLHYLDDRQNYDQALADLTQALTLAPHNPEIYYDRARAYFALGDYLAADADYTRTINLNPNDHLAWCERGRAHQRRGQHRNAINDLDQALTLNPNYAIAYQLRSISHAAIGNRQAVQNDYAMGKSLT